VRLAGACLLLLAAAPAAEAFVAETRPAPWRLAGISSDERTLRVAYEGGGCQRHDGRPVVTATAAGAVRIGVLQTVDVPTAPEEGCRLDRRTHMLDVPLGARLAGRRVVGGPRFEVRLRSGERAPRVVGLRRRDAIRVLRAYRVPARTFGRGKGVVTAQFRAPGRGLSLHVGRIEPRARLTIEIADRQTIGSVLRQGLRYRFRVESDVEAAISADLSCAGQDAGDSARPVRTDRGHARVNVANGNLRSDLRRRKAARCQLVVLSYGVKLRDAQDWLRFRRAGVRLTR